jgi:hypothetical protein
MGKSKAQEMLFWTKEEYEKFAESVKSNLPHTMLLKYFIGLAHRIR